MIWLLATALLIVAAPFVLWPLITHWQPEPEQSLTAGEAAEARRREFEELELDLASGRLGEGEAARRRRELRAS